MANVFFSLINNHRAKKGSKVADFVELRITYQRKTKYISTGIKVLPNQFKDGHVVRHPDAMMYNEKLDAIMRKAFRVVAHMEEVGVIDFEALPSMIRANEVGITFWEYVAKQADIKNVRATTRERYISYLRQITKWKFFRTFGEISVSELMRFDKFLADEGYSKGTIQSYHKYTKQFINDAIADGHIKKSPYDARRVKIERPAPRTDKFLTEEEVAKIENCIIPYNLQRVRDMFIFACYTGLAFTDMMDFKKDKVQQHDGQYIIVGKRIKDDVQYVIPMLPKALKVARKYGWRFKKISNEKYNDYLKIVALRAEVDKPISSHWARHTAGMLLLNNNIPIEVVSKILGHADIRTTQQVYAQIQIKAIVRETKKLMTMGI